MEMRQKQISKPILTTQFPFLVITGKTNSQKLIHITFQYLKKMFCRALSSLLEGYSETKRTSNMELFAKRINNFQSLTMLAKSSAFISFFEVLQRDLGVESLGNENLTHFTLMFHS